MEKGQKLLHSLHLAFIPFLIICGYFPPIISFICTIHLWSRALSHNQGPHTRFQPQGCLRSRRFYHLLLLCLCLLWLVITRCLFLILYHDKADAQILFQQKLSGPWRPKPGVRVPAWDRIILLVSTLSLAITNNLFAKTSLFWLLMDLPYHFYNWKISPPAPWPNSICQIIREKGVCSPDRCTGHYFQIWNCGIIKLHPISFSLLSPWQRIYIKTQTYGS